MDTGEDPGGLVLFLLLLCIDIVTYGFSAAVRSWHPEEPEEESREGKDRDKKKSPQDERRKKRLSAIDEESARGLMVYVNAVSCVLNLVFGAVFGVSWTKHLALLFNTVLGMPTAARVLGGIAAWFLLLVIVLTFGIRIPGALARKNPEAWILRCYPFYRLLRTIVTPVAWLSGVLSKGILRCLGIRDFSMREDVTEKELRSMVSDGQQQGVIEKTEAEMISNIFDFSDKEAGDIMTHRNDIRAVDATFSLREAIDYMLGQHNSRFPVYQDNIDNIRGILNLRDAVKYLHQHPEDGAKRVGSIAGILRTPIYVPETKDIDDLFRQMQKEKQQMVIVIDEYGQTSGIASMEDILEEIVGNIMDEYDIDEHHITATGNKNEFIVDGRAELSELTKVFGIRFEDERFETVNGFMMAAMDRVPQPGDKFSVEYGGFRFRILSVKDRQVSKVMMTRLPRTAPGKAETRQDAGKPAEEEKNSSKVT